MIIEKKRLVYNNNHEILFLMIPNTAHKETNKEKINRERKNNLTPVIIQILYVFPPMHYTHCLWGISGSRFWPPERSLLQGREKLFRLTRRNMASLHAHRCDTIAFLVYHYVFKLTAGVLPTNARCLPSVVRGYLLRKCQQFISKQC